MRLKKLSLVLGFAWAGAIALGQGMPAPPKELRKLDWMLGNWSGNVKWTMPGMSGDAIMKFKGSMEGMFQKQISDTTMQGQTTTEVGYIGYDPKKKAFTSWTFTNFAPTPRVEHIMVGTGKLVFLSEPWDVGMPGGPTHSRATLTRRGASRVDFVLEFRQGKKWSKVASGSFTKGD